MLKRLYTNPEKLKIKIKIAYMVCTTGNMTPVLKHVAGHFGHDWATPKRSANSPQQTKLPTY
jgi:hypothetical protein